MPILIVPYQLKRSFKVELDDRLITYNDSSEVINPVIARDEGQITAKMAGETIISNIHTTLRRFP